MSVTGKNLAAIDAALKQHNANCGFPVLEILMAQFEVDRLGWDDYKGIPINGDSTLGTGRFRLVCDGQHAGPVAETAGEELFTPPPHAPVEVPTHDPGRVPEFV